MKHLCVLLLMFIFTNAIFSQSAPLIADKQFMVGISQVSSNEYVNHYIKAEGDVWEIINSNFVISSDQSIYNTSLSTIGNANFSSPDWPGFNFKWLNNYPPSGVSWGLGFYKVTNSKYPGKYFFLDARDSQFGGGIGGTDFWVYYDTRRSLYRWKYRVEDNFNNISNGNVIHIWDIIGRNPNTSGLQNYWSNVLIILTDQHNPRIIWGPHPTFQATHYKVYRAISTTPLSHPEFYASVITTVSNSTFEYKDIDVAFSGNDYIYYFVQGYNGSYSNSTNIEEVNGGLYKESLLQNNANELFSFKLEQNYPNPFNPTTVIKYSIPQKDFVSIKVYDSIGKLVATLEKGIIESGNYSVQFNAENLSSGLYFYTLRTSSKSITKKMLLVR